MTKHETIEEADEEDQDPDDDDDEPKFASIIGNSYNAASMVSTREIEKAKQSSSDRLSTPHFAVVKTKPNHTLGVRAQFVINLIRNAFVEQ